MEKRSLLAILLSFVLLLVYFWTLKPQQPPAPEKSQNTSSTVSAPPQSSPDPSVAEPVLEPEAAKGEPEVLSDWQDGSSLSQWSSVSGLPVTWKLKNYFEEAGKKGGNRELLSLKSETKPRSYPFSWLLFPKKGPVLPHFSQKAGLGESKLYEAKFGDLKIEEEVSLGNPPFSFQLKLKLRNLGKAPVEVAPGLRVRLSQITEKRSFANLSPQVRQLHPLYFKEGSVERLKKVKYLPAYGEVLGDLTWAGLEDLYFLRSILSSSAAYGMPGNLVGYGQEAGQLFTDFRYNTQTLSPGETKTYEYRVFLGPKSSEALDPFKTLGLDQALDLGFLSFIAKPLLWALKFFHQFLYNWGLSIIVLTLVVRMLTYPLNKKSMASMKAMKEIQPKLKKLQEKFKDDKQRLNQEMMNLFKTHKVNPAGGCLPMILQMPIYFALYRVLYNATELHHAPFFGPYQDLSAPDPYFILPIILGFFFFLQQKLTPTTGDAAQAKIMKIMPLMFTGLMLFLPVGLVLYILVSTALGVLQQYLNQRDMKFLDLFRKKA